MSMCLILLLKTPAQDFLIQLRQVLWLGRDCARLIISLASRPQPMPLTLVYPLPLQIATAFIHLLAPAFEELGSECLTGAWGDYVSSERPLSAPHVNSSLT